MSSGRVKTVACKDRHVALFLEWLDKQTRGIGRVVVSKGTWYSVSRSMLDLGKITIRCGKEGRAETLTPEAALEMMDGDRATGSNYFEWLLILLKIKEPGKFGDGGGK